MSWPTVCLSPSQSALIWAAALAAGLVQPPRAAAQPGSPPAQEADDTLEPGSVPDGVAARATTSAPGGSTARPLAPSESGASGLLRTSTAELARPHELRIGLRGDYFSSSGLLVQGDDTQRLQGALTIGFALHPRLEIFAATMNSTTENLRTREPSSRDPQVIKAFGDLIFGSKGVWAITPDVALAGELGVKLLSSVSTLGFSPSATSLWLGPIATFDGRRRLRFPIRVHANASYYVDRSSHLYDLTGDTLQTKQVASFAYGINKSRFRAVLAADVLFENLRRRLTIAPILEYRFELITADGDPDFAEYTASICTGPSRSAACADNRDLQFLTLGLRVDVRDVLVAFAGVDVRVRSPGFPYGPPLPPWNATLGFAVPLDLDRFRRRPPNVVRTVVREKAPPAPRERPITGVILVADENTPVAGAVVAPTDPGGTRRARTLSEADGRFETVPLPEGTARLEVSAPGFAPVTTEIDVDVQPPSPRTPVQHVEIRLTRAPVTSTFGGRVRGAAGDAIAGAIVRVVSREGAEPAAEVRTDAEGRFSSTVAPGVHTVTVEAPGYARRETTFVVTTPEQPTDVEIGLVPAVPAASVAPLPPTERREASRTAAPQRGGDVVVAKDAIRSARPIRFEGPTSTLTTDAKTTLDAIAKALNDRPELSRVHIFTHWDNSLSREEAAELTRKQAEAIKEALVARGVQGDRLTADGLGSTKPVVPNLTPANRARNRRVELRLE